METTNLKDLKYGIIYLYCDRSLSHLHDPEEIVRKFVYPMQVVWIDEPGRDDLLLVARRFNVGNIGRFATVSLSLSRMNRSGGWFEAVRRFADALMGVTDTGEGDIVIKESDYGHRYYDQSSVFGEAREAELPMPSATPQDKTRVESAGRRIAEKAAKWILGEDAIINLDTSCRKEIKPEPDLLQEEEKLELKRIERERKKALERIKHEIVNYIAQYHEDPKELMAELLRGKVVVGQPGRVLVNGDLKIVLPEYDEMEIPMTAMCRTLYILFMKQRKLGKEGILLKNIDEFHDEIINIYGMVKPGANEERVARSVDNLCDPLGESLHQTISRINRCIKNVITNKELAKQYTITGTRGDLYSIQLEPDYIELPKAV